MTDNINTKLEKRLSKQVSSLEKTAEELKQELKAKKQMVRELKRTLKEKDELLLDEKAKGERYRVGYEELFEKATALEALQKKWRADDADDFDDDPAEWKKYSDNLINLAINICLKCGCSLRQTENLLKEMNETLGWGLPETPARTSIANWIHSPKISG
ncbi:MAG: hypothetical protein LBD35_05760 [Prevotellaceae bacterium]|jgi:chromosome segregation ATPase|nr:hypothetical protein [Prevotellaceae bacterium]